MSKDGLVAWIARGRKGQVLQVARPGRPPVLQRRLDSILPPRLAWAADGLSVLIASPAPDRVRLEQVALRGAVRRVASRLGDLTEVQAVLPSPDGRSIAVSGSVTASDPPEAVVVDARSGRPQTAPSELVGWARGGLAGNHLSSCSRSDPTCVERREAALLRTDAPTLRCLDESVVAASSRLVQLLVEGPALLDPRTCTTRPLTFPAGRPFDFSRDGRSVLVESPAGRLLLAPVAGGPARDLGRATSRFAWNGLP